MFLKENDIYRRSDTTGVMFRESGRNFSFGMWSKNWKGISTVTHGLYQPVASKILNLEGALEDLRVTVESGYGGITGIVKRQYYEITWKQLYVPRNIKTNKKT